MKATIFSIRVFGIYLLFTGLSLLLVPDVLLNLLMIDETPNIWMQLLGLALSILAFYYLKAAKDQNIDFIKGTVPVRIGQIFGVATLVILYEGPYILIAVSLVETFAGFWTWLTLRKA